jgi:hypothetical protein
MSLPVVRPGLSALSPLTSRVTARIISAEPGHLLFIISQGC